MQHAASTATAVVLGGFTEIYRTRGPDQPAAHSPAQQGRFSLADGRGTSHQDCLQGRSHGHRPWSQATWAQFH